MERLTRSLSTTTSVDINRAWRRKVYDGKVDGSPDLRKDVKTARFGENHHHGRLWKIKKLFNLDGGGSQDQQEDTNKKIKSKIAGGSRDAFESRLMSEIYKNMSASHELASIYN